MTNCTKCTEPMTADNESLSDEHCLSCWEVVCNEGWWAMIAAIEEIGPENFYEDWEGDRA